MAAFTPCRPLQVGASVLGSEASQNEYLVSYRLSCAMGSSNVCTARGPAYYQRMFTAAVVKLEPIKQQLTIG
jgi:hypothetical protein